MYLCFIVIEGVRGKSLRAATKWLTEAKLLARLTSPGAAMAEPRLAVLEEVPPREMFNTFELWVHEVISPVLVEWSFEWNPESREFRACRPID